MDRSIIQLESEFGSNTPLNKSRGKTHDYLGMVFDFNKAGEVTICMSAYISMILHDIPIDMKGNARTPAANHLFTVNNTNPEKLTTIDADIFVRIVMQLLYLSQRGRPDIRTAVSFLCGRLKSPDVDDCKKLSIVE